MRLANFATPLIILFGGPPWTRTTTKGFGIPHAANYTNDPYSLAGETGLEPAYSDYGFNDRVEAGADTPPKIPSSVQSPLAGNPKVATQELVSLALAVRILLLTTLVRVALARSLAALKRLVFFCCVVLFHPSLLLLASSYKSESTSRGLQDLNHFCIWQWSPYRALKFGSGYRIRTCGPVSGATV